MDPEEFFHLVEKAIETVSSIRYPKLRGAFEGKEVWKVCYETAIGGADSLVCIVPVFSIFQIRPFFQEPFPFSIPFFEELHEIFFTDEGEGSPESRQFLTGLELRLRREIPLQDGPLVEVAHLDRKVGEDLSHAFSAIQDHVLEDKPLCFELFPRPPIHLRLFSFHEMEENVAFEFRRTEHQHPVTSGEERDIGCENERLRGDRV